MTVTSPLLDLQRELDDTIEVQKVSGVTVDSPMPHTFIVDFTDLLRRLTDLLTAALQPLKASVIDELTPEQVTLAFADPQPLQFVAAPVEEWDPNGRRPAYPASPFSTVHMIPGGDGTLDASITR
jgi:hypothetical protein